MSLPPPTPPQEIEGSPIISIGVLIRNYRHAADMSQVEVEEQSGVTQGHLSKIENGEITKPDFRTIYAIAPSINLPLAHIAPYYLEIERKSGTLLHILNIAIEEQELGLVSIVARKFLSATNADSLDLLDQLFELAQQTPCKEDIKLILYDTLIRYSMSHGVQLYIAKGMLQKYLINRNDFSRVNETYDEGKHALLYAEFLSMDERITLYYKLGVHALNLRKFKECITICRRAVKEDDTQSSFRAYSVFAICWSYYYLEDYAKAEKYLEAFRLFDFDFVKEYSDFMTAQLDAQKGNTQQAIVQFQQCLNSSFSHKINCANELLGLYLLHQSFDAIEQLIQNEKQFIQTDMKDLFIKEDHAYYYFKKGKYFNEINKQHDAMNFLTQSIYLFSEIQGHHGTFECLEVICHIYKSTQDIQIAKQVNQIFENLKSIKECVFT